MIDFRAASDALADLIEQLSDDRLGSPTPCAEFTVRDLLLHVDEGATGFISVAGDEVRPAANDVGGAANRRRVATNVADLAIVWAEPGAWNGQSDVGGLMLPNETWGNIALTEVVVHGWDLAVATGCAFTPPDNLVQACLDHVESFLAEPPIPELWGDRIDVRFGSLLDRTVAVAGRDPRSWPRSTGVSQETAAAVDT